MVGKEPVWVSREDMQGSDCLQALLRMGKVRVWSGQRCRVAKEPKRPVARAVLMSRPSRVARTTPTTSTSIPAAAATPPATPPATPAASPTTTIVHTGITPEEAAKMAQTAAEEAAKQAIASMTPLMQSMLDTMQKSQTPSATPEDFEARIEQAMARALGSVQIGHIAGTDGKAAPTDGPDEPVFIPTGIVKADAESLDVQSKSSEDDGGLDDAASALKALRNRKRKK